MITIWRCRGAVIQLTHTISYLLWTVS